MHAMGGRAPFRGPIQLDIVMYAAQFEPKLLSADYMGGIMDTLDGSHGSSFTYLPVVYEGDCQVCSGKFQLFADQDEHYEIRVTFRDETIVSG